MADPLGFISGGGGIDASKFLAKGGGSEVAPEKSFKDVLTDSLNQANKAQQEATRAVEDLATGQRNDLEGVILATNKADDAFRMLQALRNKMMDAYDEIKQIRT
ncbi:MAG: flagellar hook-basal body complex protein FliE [Phycisphaerales bacterium]|jgi:flagellar hook-basal body complex protein FliE